MTSHALSSMQCWLYGNGPAACVYALQLRARYQSAAFASQYAVTHWNNSTVSSCQPHRSIATHHLDDMHSCGTVQHGYQLTSAVGALACSGNTAV